MKTRIRIGHCYIAKLSKRQAPVRVDSTREDGGWNVRSLETGRMGIVREKDYFLRECTDTDMETERQPNRRNHNALPPQPSAVQTPSGNCAEYFRNSSIAGSLAQRKLSVLDAAQRVLLETNAELSTPEIIKIAIEKGYWKSSGKTPSGTLHAAMSRDIVNKGDKSRFCKGLRGKFAARF